ncbi:MAG: proton-conducting transporter membrane subunit [Flavobacteriaceae bacterium]
MLGVTLLIIFILSFLTFLLHKETAYKFIFLLLGTLWFASSKSAIDVLLLNQPLDFSFIDNFYEGSLNLHIDKLSAYFIIIVNFTSFSGYIYANKYLKPYKKTYSNLNFSLHYFNFFLLSLSMLLVVMIKSGLGFLLAWELMSLSSFFLVIFESKKPDVIKTGIRYLVQMHIAFLALLIGFILVYNYSGVLGFDGLSLLDPNLKILNISGLLVIFLCFFIGFSIKAGFFPLHTWLPHAHPAAPSHVSGVMSGVMIKMGIYGIIRVLFNLPELSLSMGLIIFFVAIFTGVFGVMSAIVQHDLKQLLAYHSIENIGIIGIGIGLGVLGQVYNQPTVAFLGWSGALLHIFNHSLFKSLLFYAAGSVYLKTHTRDLNKLGGLLKVMPYTAYAFLIGSIAISGIPPFNGFISEFLMYNGFFDGIKTAGLTFSILMLIGILGLVLIGGLALFCFTKAFGIVFLGTARTPEAAHAMEVPKSMLFAKFLPLIFIVAIGIVPVYFFRLVAYILKDKFPDVQIQQFSILDSLSLIGYLSLGLILLVFVLGIIRKWVLSKREVKKGSAWGCANTVADPVTNQYTATSFAANFNRIANPLFVDHCNHVLYKEEEIFPSAKTFETHSDDKVEVKVINPFANTLVKLNAKFAFLHTGKIQDYLLYPLVFIILIVVLSLLNII